MGNDLVIKDGEYVIFKSPGEWGYEIPIRDLSSQYWIAEWFGHMAEKTWVTKDHLVQFSEIVQLINKRV